MKLYLEKSLTGLVIFALGFLMRYFCFTQIKTASLGGLSPRAVPLIVSNAVIILAVVLLIQGLHSYIITKKTSVAECTKVKFQRFPFLLYGLMIVYAVTMSYVGYFIASFTILPIMMYTMKIRKLKNYLTIFALIIVIYLMIDVFLQIGLPKIGLFGII